MRLPALIALVMGVSGGTATGQAADQAALTAAALRPPPASGSWSQTAAVRSFNKPWVQPDAAHGTNGRAGNHPTLAWVDADRFVVADGRHPARVCDADTGRVLATFGRPEPDRTPSRQFVCSPGGHMLTLLPDAAPTVWDTATGRAVGHLPRAKVDYTAACFLPDGTTLVTYCWPGGMPTPGRVEVWAVDCRAGTVARRAKVDAQPQGQALMAVGPFVVLDLSRHVQVFDSHTWATVLDQADDVDEHVLFVDPPAGGRPGTLAAVEFKPAGFRGDLPDAKPTFRTIDLPGDREQRRWPCPIVEDAGNDHRYQAGFAVSPDRELIAVSQEGRVNVFRFASGRPVSRVAAVRPPWRPTVAFLDATHALFDEGVHYIPLRVVDVTTGRVTAEMPDGDGAAVSPGGRRLLVKRLMMPAPGVRNGYFMLTEPVIAVWTRADGPATAPAPGR